MPAPVFCEMEHKARDVQFGQSKQAYRNAVIRLTECRPGDIKLLGVGSGKCVCSVVRLANGTAIHCDGRLASNAYLSQRKVCNLLK